MKIIAVSFYFILLLICYFFSWAEKLSRIENFKIRKGLISPFLKSSVPKRTRKQKSIFIITNFLKRWKKRNGDNFLEINVASCFINQIYEFLFLQEKCFSCFVNFYAGFNKKISFELLFRSKIVLKCCVNSSG